METAGLDSVLCNWFGGCRKCSIRLSRVPAAAASCLLVGATSAIILLVCQQVGGLEELLLLHKPETLLQPLKPLLPRNSLLIQ